jgi:hypothetical protein
VTDASGQRTGTLRFRADGNHLQARLLDGTRQVLARGQGELTPTDEGGTFTLELQGVGGHAGATVSGRFHAPSYSKRGSFQATWRGSCEP